MRAIAGPVLLLLAGCVGGRIEWETWKDTYPPYYELPLEEKGARIEAHLLRYHLSPEGVLVYHRRYTPLAPSKPDAYRNHSDQPIWTGVLAGAYAYKYARTQAPEDRARLMQVLGGLRLLHDVTGKPGLLARSVIPRRFDVPERGGGEWHESPVLPYRFRSDASRDQYSGVLFGYAAAAALGDEEIDAFMAPTVAAIADHVRGHGERIVDVDGERTRHGSLSARIAGIPIAMNAGIALGFARLAWKLTGEERFEQYHERLVDRGYPGATHPIRITWFGKTNYNNDNMNLLVLHALATLGGRGVYERNLARLWRKIRHEGNAFAHAAYAMWRELPEAERFDLEETLKLYPVDPGLRPHDVTELPGVRRALFPNRYGDPRNRTPLPLHLRKRSSFIWKSDPYALRSRAPEPGESVSGLDFLLAYWMSRAPGSNVSLRTPAGP